MKKLLALFIALLSLNLYGADKPKTEFDKHGNLVTNIRADKPTVSRTGLEGWGKKEGVHILVEDMSHRDETFDKKAIKNQVELKLRLAGIKVVDKIVSDMLIINMKPVVSGNQRLLGYSLTIYPKRWMSFVVDGKVYRTIPITDMYGGQVSPDYRKFLDKHLDQLLIDYLKANPKK